MEHTRPFKKAILQVVSILTSLFSTLFLLNLDIHQSWDSVIWDYQIIRIYVPIGALHFLILNIFLQIENLVLGRGRSPSVANLNGIYGYILGTTLYVIYFSIISSYHWRVYGLLIPIILTFIGFNLRISMDSNELARKRALILTNIVLLIFWAMTTVYLYRDLEFKKQSHEEAKVYFKKMDERYLNHGDSLWRVFSRAYINYDNDSLESLLNEQMKLYSEFSEYRATNNYIKNSQLDYIYNYEEMRTMMLFGLIIVILINGVYLTYLIQDIRFRA